MSNEVAIDLLRQGMAAAKAKDVIVARSLLLQATDLDPELLPAWMWLAAVAETPDQSVSYLERVLVRDPTNARALAGLEWAKSRGAEPSTPTGGPNGSGAKPRPAALRTPVVLVVDDSPTIRKLVELTLVGHGYKVVAASDGLEAMARISEGYPDLILADITMPRMDGYQLCKVVKENEDTCDVPIVMLSGKDGEVDKSLSRSLGSTGYITKPFQPDELLEMVDTHARREERDPVRPRTSKVGA